MTLRKQIRGGGKHANRWTLENIVKGLEEFHKQNNRYPTDREIVSFEYLPSSRTIQRKFGGLVNFRKQLKLRGQSDFTRGKHSSERAKKINKRSHALEKKVYDYLINIFGLEFVHREYFFTDDRRTRTDFFVYCKNGNFSIDVFYPADKHSLVTCLNSKMRIYGSNLMLQYPVIFLQMNDSIREEGIQEILQRKKNKLLNNQKLFTFNQFKNYCSTKASLSVSSS